MTSAKAEDKVKFEQQKMLASSSCLVVETDAREELINV